MSRLEFSMCAILLLHGVYTHTTSLYYSLFYLVVTAIVVEHNRARFLLLMLFIEC